MRETIIENIKNFSSKDNKLECGVAFKIAKKLDVDVEKIGSIANEIGIKIANCELGQFGKYKKEIAPSSKSALEKLKPLIDDQDRVFCSDARNAAQGVGLKTVRATLKKNKIDVKYCKLGCFKEKKGKTMVVKTKTWIENSKGELLFGKGKTEVLDVISQSGSIKAASEILDMNYKKCWNHLKILQNNLDDDLFETRQGGGSQAGTTLKPKAYELIKAYKQLEKDIEEFANQRFKELFLTKEE